MTNFIPIQVQIVCDFLFPGINDVKNKIHLFYISLLALSWFKQNIIHWSVTTGDKNGNYSSHWVIHRWGKLTFHYSV